MISDMLYAVTLSVLLSFCLPAKIPLPKSTSDDPDITDEYDNSQEHFHDVIGSLDTFLDTLSEATQTDGSASVDPVKVYQLSCNLQIENDIQYFQGQPVPGWENGGEILPRNGQVEQPQ